MGSGLSFSERPDPVARRDLTPRYFWAGAGEVVDGVEGVVVVDSVVLVSTVAVVGSEVVEASMVVVASVVVTDSVELETVAVAAGSGGAGSLRCVSQAMVPKRRMAM